MSGLTVRQDFERECLQPPEGISFCEDLGYYSTKDPELLPDMDWYNELYDAFCMGALIATARAEARARLEREKSST